MAPARKQKLKVFRTPIGFHDAYVAAPSQKAALEAWGAESNLFAQGIAERVDDPQLMKAPLERLGEVVKVLRGSAEEQAQTLSRTELRAKPRPARTKEKGETKKPPRPSRAAVEASEQAIAGARQRNQKQLEALRVEEEALATRRRGLEREHGREMERLQNAADKALDTYRARMTEWVDMD